MDVCKTRSSLVLQLSLSFILPFLMLPNTVNGWSYHYSNAKMDWITARKWCQDHFTDMVAIQNHGEIEYLNREFPKVAGYYWIGIRKSNNIWYWVGTNKTLTAEAENWAEGEPNNGRNNEDCVEIYIKRGKDDGKWNDEPCKKKKTALCYTASCKKDSCSNHGECVETINNHTCKCFDGFYGEKCEHVVQCSELTEPQDLTMQCDHPLGNFSYQSSCEFTCQNTGYKLAESNSSKIMCGAAGQWNDSLPTCEVVQCSKLTEPLHATMQCDHPLESFSYQSSCEFTCQKGYTLKASSSSKIMCGASGEWSASLPICEAVQCPTLQQPTHGSMHCSGDTYGKSCIFSCKDGFFLQGATEITCTESARWSQDMPYCQVVQCSELMKPLNAIMQCDHPLGNFSYQSSCEFTCQKGYTLAESSSSRIMCGATGQWNNSLLTCEAVRCPTLEDPVNGLVNCNGDSYGTSCSFSCNDGFLLQGATEITCTESAEWSQELPICQIVQCSEPIAPLHASMQCDHPFQSFSYQSSCEFTCEKGYTLAESSSSKIMCGAAGQWNDSVPTCEAVRCPTLKDAVNVKMSCNGDSFGSICKFSCDIGFNLQGESEITCTESAQWSQGMPYCQIVQCSELTDPLNATMLCHHSLGSFSYQSSCEFTCQKGYTLAESSSSKIMCGAAGQWNDSQPSCEAVRCPTLEDLANGTVNCNGDSYGTSCSFSCNDGFLLQGATEITCTESAEWSQEMPYCQNHPEPLLSPTLITGLTVAGVATILSSLSIAFWIMRKLKQKAEKFDLSSSDIEVPSQVYKSLDSLI
ncbi:E-selectin-like [Hoplias malabaricus]|uniref:E-selectin-like n=1 Tax=Hoplias malabaricus TaxID=27720 RepID=UPI003461F199